MEELIVVLACIVLNGYLSGTEMAFVSVGKPKLRELAKAGNRDARTILALRDNPERTLSIIQIGITLLGAVAAAVGGAGAEEWISPILQTRFDVSENTAEGIGILLIVLPITYLSVVAGELVPKTLALRNPLAIVLRSARWLKLADRSFGPLVTLLEWSTKKLLRVFFRKSRPEAAPGGEAESLELSALTPEHRLYVMNLVNIEKKRVKDILLPWEAVLAVDVSLPSEEVEKMILSSGHTRLPVLREGASIGILNTKEFLAFRRSGGEVWEPVVRPLVQVQETDSLLRALRLMREKRSHMAIVFAYQRRTGIVTMEDIIEEIIGDIYDEDDDGALRRLLSSGSHLRRMGIGGKHGAPKGKPGP